MQTPRIAHVMIQTRSPRIDDTATRLQAQRGATMTPARVRVLQLLLASDAAMSHQALQQAAAASGQAFDRVTLYRVLDWLAAQGLAHCVTGHDGVRRYSVSGGATGAQHDHAHFECDACGRLFCLDGGSVGALPAIPDGFAPTRTEVIVHGRCADCATAT